MYLAESDPLPYRDPLPRRIQYWLLVTILVWCLKVVFWLVVREVWEFSWSLLGLEA